MSDHISGPRALANAIADITDVFAFPSPEREDRLVLVMNTLPFARVSNAFSEGLIYRFRLRPLTTNPPGTPAPFDAGPEKGATEYVFDCVFSAPTTSAPTTSAPTTSAPTTSAPTTAEAQPFEQEGTCITPGGESVSFRVNDESGGAGHGVRVFAGARWDPFILDAPAALKTVASGRLAFAELGAIYMDGKNVLGLVIEVDTALLGGATLVGVVAETLTRGVFQVRIERVGRPEVKNLLLGPKQFDLVNRDLEIRDLFNMEDAFHIQHGYEGAYRARLDANLAFWDGLDGTTDWPTDDGRHPLTELVLADYLVVDTGKPYQEQGSFLEIELATRQGRSHRTAGGRTINDDAMDTFFTTFVNAGNGPAIRDGVDTSSRPASDTFPYLAPPNQNPPEKPEHH